MKIVPPSGIPGKESGVRFTTRPKALVVTALSVFGAAVCIASVLCDFLRGILGVALVAEGFMIVVCTLFWRFERPREVKLTCPPPEPPVIHGA